MFYEYFQILQVWTVFKRSSSSLRHPFIILHRHRHPLHDRPRTTSKTFKHPPIPRMVLFPLKITMPPLTSWRYVKMPLLIAVANCQEKCVGCKLHLNLYCVRCEITEKSGTELHFFESDGTKRRVNILSVWKIKIWNIYLGMYIEGMGPYTRTYVT